VFSEVIGVAFFVPHRLLKIKPISNDDSTIYNTIWWWYILKDVVMCLGVETIRRGIDWMIAFIDHFTHSTRNYKSYSAIADLHTTARAKPFPALCLFKSPFLVTDVNVEITRLPALRYFLSGEYHATELSLFPRSNCQLSTLTVESTRF
jgi:hypothetical protein